MLDEPSQCDMYFRYAYTTHGGRPFLFVCHSTFTVGCLDMVGIGCDSGGDDSLFRPGFSSCEKCIRICCLCMSVA